MFQAIKSSVGRQFAASVLLALAAVTCPSAVLATPGVPFTQYAFWNTKGQLAGEILPDPDGAGPLPNPASRYSYDPDGRLILLETGTTVGVSATDFSAMEALQKTEYLFNVAGEKIKEVQSSRPTVATAWVVASVIQYSYDANTRSECTAIRMNPAVFGTPPADACTLGSQGTGINDFGPDRISKNVYDAAGRLTAIQRGFATPSQQAYASRGAEHLLAFPGMQRYETHQGGKCVFRSYSTDHRVELFSDRSWRLGRVCLVSKNERIVEIVWSYQLVPVFP